MRKLYLFAMAALLPLFSCQKEAEITPAPETAAPDRITTFYATVEGSAQNTKVYVDENLDMRWNAGDFISVFNGNSKNDSFQFQGNDGDREGTFTESSSSTDPGTAIDKKYAVYPSRGSNTINPASHVLTVSLPAYQEYKEKSFGPMDNTMVAVTEGDHFSFKNVCGYLVLRLYGNASVERVTLRGNNGEKIAGKAHVSIAPGGVPSVTMDDSDATEEIAVNCFVLLGTSPADYKEFWFVVPPVTFTQGITVTVHDINGRQFIKSTTKQVTVTRNIKNSMATFNVDYTDMTAAPLTFEAIEDDTEVSFYISSDADGGPDGIEYSYNRGEWFPYTSETAISMHAGDAVSFRGNKAHFGTTYFNTQRFKSTKTCYVYGNVMSLVSSTGFPNNKTLTAEGAFQNLFYNCRITNHPEYALILPATTLTESCYESMFAYCSSLTSAPVLPATEMAEFCYYHMFDNCSSLTSAPVLPATKMALCCYADMFEDCSSLTSAPVLPATEMEQACYDSMFEGCSSLTSAPALPATKLHISCYRYMFRGCSSLVSAPVLPATKLSMSCYEQMFKDCSQLNYVECLATDISSIGCTDSWLSGVSATGTFVKDPSMTGWTSGESGIPDGWTVN